MAKDKKIFLILAIFILCGTLVFAGGPKRRIALDQRNAPKPYAEGEVLVKFKAGIDLAAVNNFATAQALKLKKRFKFLSQSKGQEIVLLKSTKKVDAEVLARALSSLNSVEYATPNYRRELAATPNDTYYGSLWGLHNTGQSGGTIDADIDAPEAWDISTGSSSVVVAVIDTGFDYTHPDLAANAWKNPREIAGNGIDDDGNGYIDDIYGIDPAGTNGTVGDSDPMDGYGHGTHCAGSIGARGNNSLGVVGVNWNVKIMGLKFFDDAGEGGFDADSIECIQYAVYQKTHGQNVVAINASWGSTGGLDSGALRDAIGVACDAGIVFCAAAGNGGTDGIGDNNETTHHYPSDYTLPGIISVAATDRNDALGSFSNYGVTSVDLGAPGVAILSTIPPVYVPGTNDIFFDNMEGGVGNWNHGAISGTDYWQITTDQEGFANVSFPVPSPTHFWSDRPGSNYADNSNVWLAYNANIDLSGYVGQKTYFAIGSALAFEVGDHGYVEFSNNGGSTWTVIHDFTDEGWYWSNWSWLIPESFKTTQFRMRFRLVGNNDGTTWIGWLIDDVGIGLVNTYYDSWNGTSMATPHVAGAVGYLASIFPNETVAQRKSRILYGGDSKASLAGRTVTGRRLNLYGSYSYTPPAQTSITVTSPNGGEVWMIGTAHNITWTSTGTVGAVEIHYSRDSGENWTSIDSNETNDGVFLWTIPTITPSTNCLVRVRERLGDLIPSDTSDEVFAITANTAETVTAPTTPSGPASGMAGGSYTYSTGGSSSSSGHTLQYLFDWGDSSDSGWLAVGTTSAAHVWSTAGTYNVRAMARCSLHWVQSAWSPTLPVTLDETPTWVAVSRFEACADESVPTVEWHTASELGVVGFNLWRQDRVSKQYDLVNPGLLPALANSAQGGFYRFVDPMAFSGEPVTYRLEEINAQGRTMSYGPFTVTFGVAAPQESLDPGMKTGQEEESAIYGYQRFGRERSLYEQERLDARRRELQKGAALAASQGSRRVRIAVKGRGLIYVSAAQFAGKLGMSQNAAAALISGYNLKLTGLDQEIPWLADAAGAGLFFYNEGLETVYSDRNIYFLEPGRGLAMETLNGGNAGPADPGQSFQDTLHFEGNRYALLLPSMNPAGDLWFWDYVIAGDAAKSFPIQVPGVAGTGNAVLTVSLYGATDTAASDDHHAVISLNGRQIGDAVWGGAKAHEFAISFAASLLQDGANTVTVSGALDTGAPYGTFYVEAFDLSYQRYYKAVDNSLVCRGDGNSVVTVSGLTELQTVVLDVTTPNKPKQLTGAAPDVSGRVTFIPRAAANTYLVSGLNASMRPISVVGDQSAQLKGASNSAEYIVITPEEFMETAQTAGQLS